MDIDNLNPNNIEWDDKKEEPVVEKIHIRIFKRNGRKVITEVSGIDPKFDTKMMLKHLKKRFSCNGHIAEEKLKLTGDHRTLTRDFLIENHIAEQENIIMHGW